MAHQERHITPENCHLLKFWKSSSRLISGIPGQSLRGMYHRSAVLLSDAKSVSCHGFLETNSLEAATCLGPQLLTSPSAWLKSCRPTRWKPARQARTVEGCEWAPGICIRQLPPPTCPVRIWGNPKSHLKKLPQIGYGWYWWIPDPIDSVLCTFGLYRWCTIHQPCLTRLSIWLCRHEMGIVGCYLEVQFL